MLESAVLEEERIACMTGNTRLISSSIETSSASGRVEQPPISNISAPSSTNFNAWERAESTLLYNPPSENESGVTLITPIIKVFVDHLKTVLLMLIGNILLTKLSGE